MNSRYFVYSYFNRKIGEFIQPIASDVPPEAFALGIRRAMVMKPKEAIAQNMDECRLHHVGYFDFMAGKLIPLDKPAELLDCLEILAPFVSKPIEPVKKEATAEKGDEYDPDDYEED